MKNELYLKNSKFAQQTKQKPKIWGKTIHYE